MENNIILSFRIKLGGAVLPISLLVFGVVGTPEDKSINPFSLSG